MECGRRIGHVHVASRVGKDLHFIVNTAGVSIGAVSEGEVAMDESVSRSLVPVLVGQTPMVMCQGIAKRNELLPSGLRG